MRDILPTFAYLLPAKKNQEEDTPRTPPALPTPLDFPRCEPCRNINKAHDFSSDLSTPFGGFIRTGSAFGLLESLNVTLINNVDLDSLLPPESLPPLAWLQKPISTDYNNTIPNKTTSTETLSNGGPIPNHESFYPRAKELLHENDDAFRTVNRQAPRANHLRAQVIHYRKFWEGLSLMAEYWDTSLDKYSKNRREHATAMDIDQLRSQAQEPDQSDNLGGGEPREEETYTGRRIDTGRSMPPKHREDTVFAFVETVAWAFRSRLEYPRVQVKLNLQNIMVPVVPCGNIYRLPENPTQARRGILEGPIAGVSCRNETIFRRPEDAQGEGKEEALDLLKEVGLSLMIAQKRSREGQEESVPGKDQWWATKPRWGGGRGGEFGASGDAISEKATSLNPPRKKAKKNMEQNWRKLRPPPSTWEKGVNYTRVGKDDGEDDDIYLISSVNHHISIVHVRVHQRYLEYLSKRTQNKAPPQQEWHKLEIKRSKWFDLLVADDRVQAMRAIWAMMSWLMRKGNDR